MNQEINNNTSDLSSLISSYEFIKEYCSKSNENVEIIGKLESLIESVKLFGLISAQYSFENLNVNGFTMYNRIMACFAGEIVNQIKAKDKIDSNFIKCFDIIFTYRDWAMGTYNVLINEESGIQNGKELLAKELGASSKYFFNSVQ